MYTYCPGRSCPGAKNFPAGIAKAPWCMVTFIYNISNHIAYRMIDSGEAVLFQAEPTGHAKTLRQKDRVMTKLCKVP